MENETSPYQQYIPKLVLKCLDELAVGLIPFEDKDKVIIVERIIPFVQALCDGQQNIRSVYENTFLWIIQTYRKKAKQLSDSNLQDYFFNGSFKFFPELKQADAPESWIGFQLEEKDFDDYLVELNFKLMQLREILYLRIDPETDEDEQKEIKTAYLSLKQVGLYFNYLNTVFKICEDKAQLARMANKVSGHGEHNLQKKINYPLGQEMKPGQSLKSLKADIKAVRAVFEDAGIEAILKNIDRDLKSIEDVEKGGGGIE